MTNQRPYIRWYDKQPKLAQAVRLTVLLPDQIITIISEGLIQIADRDFQAKEKAASYKTLGTEKVLGLYKSKNKRRDYDQNASLHQLMNYMFVLSDHNQARMADHILKLGQYVQAYIGTCNAFKQEQSMETVATLTQTYVEKNPAEVEAFLSTLRQEYQLILRGGTRKSAAQETPGSEPAPPDASLKDMIQDDQSGLKIRRTL